MKNEYKPCKICNQIKSLNMFHKCGNKDGRFNVCKVCHHERLKRFRATPEGKAKMKIYQRNTDLKNRYGITRQQYEEMIKSQNNLCAICGEPPNKTKAKQTWCFAIDHNHKTNKVRALLCHLCNRGIAMFKEEPKIMLKAIKYIKFHNKSLPT